MSKHTRKIEDDKHTIGQVSDVARAPWQGEPINIVFDGPPGPESGRFIEVEDDDGRSINVGQWLARPNGWWELRIEHPGEKFTDAPEDWRGEETIKESVFLQPTPTPDAPLDIDQLGRVEALRAARSVLQATRGPFGGSDTGGFAVEDLIRIARFITTGQDPAQQR